LRNWPALRFDRPTQPREGLHAAYRATHQYETGLLTRLIDGLQTFRGCASSASLTQNDLTSAARRCRSGWAITIPQKLPRSWRLRNFHLDGNFYALNLSERLGVEKTRRVSCESTGALQHREEADRLLAALRELAARYRCLDLLSEEPNRIRE